MNSKNRYIATWICLGLVMGFIGPSALFADTYEASYARGIEALEAEQWSKAAEWFRDAIAEQPEAGGELVVSGEEQLYIPYHQLALALYFDDALEDAEAAWVESTRQGVVADQLPDALEAADRYRADIARRLTDGTEGSSDASAAQELERLGQAIETQLARATRPIVKLGEPKLQSVLDRNAELMQRRDVALDKLRQAQQIQAEHAEDLGQLSEAHALAVEAAASLEAVLLKTMGEARRQRSSGGSGER